MGVVVTFDYPTWVQLFPQFAYLSSQQIGLYFNLAEQLHRNDGSGPITDATTQSNLLNLLTAHIAQLFAPAPNSTQPARDPSVVGRITSASEGSVSVATEFPMPSNPSSAWFMQTQWGTMYHVATAPFRTARYLPPIPKPVNPWPMLGSDWWGIR